ncbi:hypothetical protein CC78DRAFT_588300 [Lojkania enalia]|uniref:Ankyrin repeat protein n=1 Tax=Lojkania enalia TaxID=147567 RepID=A0A9P4JXG1_9PLEO|nr:hypothetical protein CC78DRAFT_588300 [Didymosphaeria enalia]
MLLEHCQRGNFPQCHELLDAGATALSKLENISALKYLVMYDNANVSRVIDRVINAGAQLDHWMDIAVDDDLILGTSSGVPLQWAIMHRNVPAIHAMTARDTRSQEANIEKAFLIATTLHFYEILDILRNWAIGKYYTPLADWISSLFVVAAAHLEYYLPRLLRHGNDVHKAVIGDSKSAQWTPFVRAVQGGLYHIASMLLLHGANKDATFGWLGGTTPLFHILHAWPDVPTSRVRYMLEELPRQGFGHASFIGWPTAKGNLLYCFSMAVRSHYRNSYKFGETMKYIISSMGDTTCINELDCMGCTALNMAACSDNLEVVRGLIEAGADVNMGLGIAPLDAAKQWRDEWERKERMATENRVTGERR